MAFDDLHLDRTEDPTPSYTPQEPEGGSLLRWIVVGLAGVAAGGLLTFWWMSRAQPTPAAPPTTTAADVVAPGSGRPVPQPLTLPALADSDSFIRDLVSALSNHPTLARLVATPGIVRGTTRGVLQIGDGQTPVDWLRVLRPGTRLDITGTEVGPISAASYERWNQVAVAIVSVSPADAAQLYVNVKPLLDQAYVELGQPGGNFDTAITRAIQTLKDTPQPATAPQLQRRTGYFEHDDPELRTLRPVQKQLLLLGPENRRALMAWLDEFSKALGGLR